MSSNNGLFRQEVLLHRADRLHGSVSLATPMSWQVIGLLLLAILVATLCFLFFASYARVETVTGAVALDRGVATIVPTRAGRVAQLDVVEGQRVAAGQSLAVIRAEEDLTDGQTAPQRIKRSLDEQDARLANQGRAFLAAAQAERARLNAQITGLAAEVDGLEAQIVDQRRLLETSQKEVQQVREVARRGFISRRDMEAREATMISRRQQLSQFIQTRSAKQASIAEARRAMATADASAEAQVADAESDRAAVAQQIAQADLARGYAITSPVDGRVTGLTARLGQPASVEQQLMMIIPARSRARVELYVPTAAAGFLRDGQEVRVAVDAFPYQRFGTIAARITDISTAPIAREGENGVQPVFLVIATLHDPTVMAFGRKQPLLPGMTLTARIITERRSLLEWLFEPLFAVGNR
ncbi:MAG: HlyD family efflux transporter periplasmic adaptor subunit [Sphingobium sp.]